MAVCCLACQYHFCTDEIILTSTDVSAKLHLSFKYPYASHDSVKKNVFTHDLKNNTMYLTNTTKLSQNV